MHVTAWTPFPPPHHHHLPSQHSVQPKWTPRNTELQLLPTWKQRLPVRKQSQYPWNIHPAPAESSKCADNVLPSEERKKSKKKIKKRRRKQTTHPDPLPPTMAIFFPAGTQNVIPRRIVCPGTYSKYTSSKVMVDVGGSTCSTGAPTSLWHHRHKLNLCDDVISIQRHYPEHAQAEFVWWHMCYGYQHSPSLSWTRTSWIHVMTHVLRLSAFSVTILNTHKLNSCDDTCVKAISIQRHRHEHTQAEFMWWHMC